VGTGFPKKIMLQIGGVTRQKHDAKALLDQIEGVIASEAKQSSLYWQNWIASSPRWGSSQ
jgi:hypothetical protein